MSTRAAMWGIHPRRMRRRTTAHITAITERLDALQKALETIEEDPAVDRLLAEFRADVARWEMQIGELIEYFEEEID